MGYRDRVLHLGGISAAELIEHYGSPLYVYEAATIERQVARLTAAMSRFPFRPFYAMKANGNLEILRRVAARGFGCDAVSPGEIFLAKNAGFTGSDIWFTCSNVSDDDLIALNDSSVIVNVNSRSEIDRLIRLELPNRIALRINPDVGAGHHRDVVTGGFGVKFGIDVAELNDLLMIARDNNLRVVGLHAHIGSGITDLKPLADSARCLVSLSTEIESLEWLNFGGGISAPYRPGEPEFPLDEYGIVLDEIAGNFLRERGLTGILEPGRFVVAESGVLLVTVTSKRVSAGYEWIGVDSGFNHLVRPSKYGSYHHIVNASDGEDGRLRPFAVAADDPDRGAIVAGNLCESGDVFTRDGENIRPRRIGAVRQGDILALCDAGAYGFSMGSHYNARLLPAEVLVENGDAKLVRRRQTMESLLDGMI
jgi:diaminopimelate decarboxylase